MAAWGNDGVGFGLIVPQGWRLDLAHIADPVEQFEHAVRTAQAAERLGFDSIWLYDHLQTRAGEPESTFECWTTLAALARETSRVRLGQLVTCTAYRNPALLAKMATTLHVASHGRLVLGLGAGWDDREYAAYGYGDALPPVGERLRRLGEAAGVVRAMWSDGAGATFEGDVYRVRGAQNLPRPVQRPHPPLLIGGAGERVLLRIVAEHADVCNLTDSFDPAFYRHKLAVLRRHCDDLGRDFDSIVRTASFTVGADAGPELFRPLVEAGISYFVVYVDPAGDGAALERFAAEVLAAFA